MPKHDERRDEWRLNRPSTPLLLSLFRHHGRTPSSSPLRRGRTRIPSWRREITEHLPLPQARTHHPPLPRGDRGGLGLPKVVALVGGLLSSTVALASVWSPPGNALFGFAPLTVQVSVNRVWGSPTVDLPPQRQRPDLYAELSMLGQQVITPVEPTPRINEDVYPDWLMSAASERAWLDPGELIPISIRIFDQDDDDDDKVLFSTLFLDPYVCEVRVGELAIAGAWINERSTCIVSIPDLRSETGSAALTISAQWVGVSPGR